MKEIWINLELYFESYEFYNFQGFFQIFLILFSILNHFLINIKMGLFFARGHVDATWQSRPRGSAPWTHAAPTWRDNITYIYYILYYA